MTTQQIIAIISIIVGWISFGCVCAYAIPQFVKIVKTKNTSSMALNTYIMFTICSSLMLAWNIGNTFKLIEDTGGSLSITYCVLTLLPAVTLNLINVIVNVASLIIKIKHIKLCKKLKVDELKLSHILLSKKLIKQNKKDRK